MPGGDIAFDQAGNLYGAAANGGYTGSGNCLTFGCGVIYKLAKANGSWAETVVYTFMGTADGAIPSSVISDAAGNIYGTANGGGNLDCDPNGAYTGCGTVFELSPSQSGWTFNILHAFQAENDGQFPEGGLLMGTGGNLYGSTISGGTGTGGVVFELTHESGSWAYNLIYDLPGHFPCTQSGPHGALAIDQGGSLYGASLQLGVGELGSIFKLTSSNGSWIYTDLHDFVANDGRYPYDGLVVDGVGNIFGTTSGGGEYAAGNVFEITP